MSKKRVLGYEFFSSELGYRLGVPKAVANVFLHEFIDLLKQVLLSGEVVRFPRFGNFRKSHTKGYTNINPATGEKQFVLPYSRIKFKCHRDLMEKELIEKEQ